MRKIVLLSCTILMSGCASSPVVYQLPSAPAVPVRHQSVEVNEPAVRDMTPGDAIGRELTYIFNEGREFRAFIPYGRVVPISLLPGDVVTGVSLANWDGWQLEKSQNGRGRDSKGVLIAKASTGARRTSAVVTTNGAMYMLDLVPRKSGNHSVSFHKQKKQRLAAAAAPAGSGYVLTGPMVPWRPQRVADDGRQTWIKFSPDIGATGVPAILAVDASGEPRPVNGRMIGDQFVVDGVFPGGIVAQMAGESVIATRTGR